MHRATETYRTRMNEKLNYNQRYNIKQCNKYDKLSTFHSFVVYLLVSAILQYFSSFLPLLVEFHALIHKRLHESDNGDLKLKTQ